MKFSILIVLNLSIVGTFQREQTNAITSFVDASNVYGSSDDETAGLRENGGAGGRFFFFFVFSYINL